MIDTFSYSTISNLLHPLIVMLLPFSLPRATAGAISSRTLVIASEDMKTLLFPMEERLKRFQQFLTGHTVRTKFHRKADARPGGESLNVRLTVLRAEFL